MNLDILPSLTKDYIFTYLSEEDIFEYYFECIVNTKDLICSPIRDDKNPTCKFYFTDKGILRMKDFAGYFWGDCFDAVTHVLNANPHILEEYNVVHVDVNTSKGFAIVLDRIAQDFKLHKYSESLKNTIIYTEPKEIKSRDTEYNKKATTHIEIKVRNWNLFDKAYWHDKYYLTSQDLKIGRVYAVDIAWVNKYVYYSYRNNNDVCYAYYFGKIDGIDRFKLYFPNRVKPEPRFILNTNVIQGLHLLPKRGGKYCFITKGYKDVLVMDRIFSLSAIAPQSEVEIISLTQYNYLADRFEYIFSLYDYDNTGITTALELRRRYKITPFFFAEKPFGRKKGYKGAKDISDFLEIHRLEETQNLIDTTLYNTVTKHEIELYGDFDIRFNNNFYNN